MDFDTFLETPWPVSGRDNVGSEPLDSAITLWNEKMAGYLQLMEVADNVVHIRYEDLLSDFDEELGRIAAFIPKISNGFTNVRRSVKASDNLRFEDYARRYRHHKIKNDYKKRDLEYIYRKCDDNVMSALGYRKVL